MVMKSRRVFRKGVSLYSILLCIENSFSMTTNIVYLSSSSITWCCETIPPWSRLRRVVGSVCCGGKRQNANSVQKKLRTSTENQPRQVALINNLNEQAAERKVVRKLFKWLGVAGRKNLSDKFPNKAVSAETLTDNKVNCHQTLYKLRNH